MGQTQTDKDFELDVFDKLNALTSTIQIPGLTLYSSDGLAGAFEKESRLSERRKAIIDVMAEWMDKQKPLPSSRILGLLNNEHYPVRREELEQASKQRAKRAKADLT